MRFQRKRLREECGQACERQAMAMGPFMDQAVHRVAISGSILAHILQDFGASRGDCDGILFGHLQKTISPKLEDDDEQSGMQEELTALITGFFCSGSSFSFYDARGYIDSSKLSKISGDRESRGGDPLIGWFSGRRDTPMRPSLRETAVTRYLRLSVGGSSQNKESSASPTALLRSGALSPAHMLGSSGRVTRSSPQAMENSLHTGESPSQMQGNQTHTAPLSGGKSSPIDLDSPLSDKGIKIQAKLKDGQQNSLQTPSSLKTLSDSLKCVGVPPSSPCLFMLLTNSGGGQAVHTHDYKVYQYHSTFQTFEPRTTKVVNIGPGFRVQYDSFLPVATFPSLFSYTEEESESNSSSTGSKPKRREPNQGSRRTHVTSTKEQMLLDYYTEGYKVERLASLADPDGRHQVPELEDLYSKMLLKLEVLAKQVCESSSALIKQENANKQLRLSATGLE